jgi:hypothetical protein
LLPFYTLAICIFDMVHEWMHAIDVLESNQGVGRRLPCVVAAVDEVGLDDVRRGRKVLDVDIQKRVRAEAGILFADTLAAAQSMRRPTRCPSPFNMAATEMIAREVKAKHLRQLVLVFLLWKALLLGLAAFCPGPGYDTSALILIDPSMNRHNNFSGLSRTDRLTLNLFRWDAIYFVKAAERGQLHEQEWAFSWAYSRLLGSVGQCKWIKLMFWSHHSLTPK